MTTEPFVSRPIMWRVAARSSKMPPTCLPAPFFQSLHIGFVKQFAVAVSRVRYGSVQSTEFVDGLLNHPFDFGLNADVRLRQSGFDSEAAALFGDVVRSVL